MSSLSDLSGSGSRRDRFQALYEENYHRVLGYALRRAERDDAADVVAETFLVAWRRLEDVPSGEAAVASGCFGASEPQTGSAAR